MVEPKEYENCELDGFSSGHIAMPPEPRPATYLAFSQDDLNDPDSQRTRVNALSNAKRALHFQVDLISEALGIEHTNLKNKGSFPVKLKFCVDCGVVGPRILTKLNRLRNAVEHDYYLPTKDEAEDFVDVVELFLGATNSLIRNFPDWLEMVSSEKRADGTEKLVHIEFSPNTGVISVKDTESNGKNESKEFEFKAEDGEVYYRWVSFILSKSQR